MYSNYSIKYIRAIRNVNITCGFAFLLFSVAYLFFYQKEMLLSLISSFGIEVDDVIFYCIVSGIVVLLSLISYIMKKSMKMNGIISSLCYLPSLLIMGVITSNHVIDIMWLWLLPSILVIYICMIMLINWLFDHDLSKERDFLFLSNWNNTFLMLQMAVTLLIGNTNM